MLFSASDSAFVLRLRLCRASRRVITSGSLRFAPSGVRSSSERKRVSVRRIPPAVAQGSPKGTGTFNQHVMTPDPASGAAAGNQDT